MTRIVLVEDEALVRLGLRRLLNLIPDMEVIADVSNGLAALEAIRRDPPDLVLSDIRMPGMGGIELLKALREQGLAMPVILLTTFEDERAFLQAMHAGASAYLRKDISLEALREAIEQALRGGRTMAPVRGDAAPLAVAATEPVEALEPLTPREVEVLRLMAAGHSNREIAEAIHAGEATIKTHASSILAKLGVRDRTRAVLKGLERGLI
jgi:DNA-binding NarL/FixJ family response regulator